jgi:hypothetical protein
MFDRLIADPENLIGHELVNKGSHNVFRCATKPSTG